MTTILLEVEEETAQAFTEASETERRKYRLLLGLRLRELTSKSARPLQQVIEDIGEAAESRGMTPELLDQLLEDE